MSKYWNLIIATLIGGLGITNLKDAFTSDKFWVEQAASFFAAFAIVLFIYFAYQAFQDFTKDSRNEEK